MRYSRTRLEALVRSAWPALLVALALAAGCGGTTSVIPSDGGDTARADSTSESSVDAADAPPPPADVPPPDVPPADVPPPDVPPQCTAPETLCGGRCVNTQTDGANCGACGAACPAGQACMAGACRIVCPMGQTLCGAACATLATDNAHCGACDRRCPAGQVCSMGVCTIVCAPPLTTCRDAMGAPVCANTQSDPAHCGMCGVACPAGQSCMAGACRIVCPTGQTLCGAACATLATDPTNCGACGTACPGTVACRAGRCGGCAMDADCPSAERCVSGVCAPLTGAVFAIHEPVAEAGAVVQIEGSFGPTATVNFPGGASVPATMLGPSRIAVTVPAGATAGPLTVTTNGMTTGSLPFRRTSYALGLQTFRARYHQADYARQMPRLSTGRYQAASAVIGNYLYVLGGGNDTTDFRSVERAVINADGTLGQFRDAGVQLTRPRRGVSVTVIGSWVYAVGGRDGATLLDSVDRAAINPDGTLGPFAVVPGVTLGTARGWHASVVAGSYLYVTGGVGTSGAIASVERAPIRPDGTLGPFAVVMGSPLRTARNDHSAHVIGSYVYVVGGYPTTPGVTASIERATIAPDGTIGPFEAAGSLATARGDHTGTVLGGHLYVVGGTTAGGAFTRTVERAAIGAGGALGPFAVVPNVALATARDRHVAEVVGNHLYVVGGFNGGAMDGVEYAWIDAGATVGPFATTGTQLVAPRYDLRAMASGPSVYVITGTNSGAPTGYRSVERAPVAPDGTVGAFLDAGLLTAPRTGGMIAVIGDFVYVLGGNPGGADLGTVERAAIRPDGTLDAFATFAGSTLVTPRSFGVALVVDGFLYVAGGSGRGGNLATVERAAINADGSIGAFAGAGSLLADRYVHTGAVLGDRAYVVAGNGGSGLRRPVETATIATGGSLSAWSAGPMLVQGRYNPASVVVGASLVVLGGFGTGPLDSLEAAPISADGALGTFAIVAGVRLTQARYDIAALVLGNYAYVFGGFNDPTAVRTVDRGALR